jgi:uncharacterized membrane protein
MKANPAENHSRSITKAISYRILSILADATAAYILTKSFTLTARIVALTTTYSTILYYLHERAWANIHWGRNKKDKVA